ncbi:MAG: ribonuclease I [Pseudomonadota bacterium]
MLRIPALLVAIYALTFISTEQAHAQTALEGHFIAQAACPATKKLTSDNPGEIVTSVGQSYVLLGANNEPASHFLILVPDAPVTERRWVPAACGLIDIPPLPSNDDSVISTDPIENVLAASWQPTFCATARGRTKTECRALSPNRPEARQFSIHGLWPDDLHDREHFPCYCDFGTPRSCEGSQPSVSSLSLSTPLRAKLSRLMPGTRSGLHLYQWSKHGSCYEDFNSGPEAGADPEEYYSDTILLMEQLNASAVGRLFADNLGQELTFAEVATAFDRAFGPGAGKKVTMTCRTVDGQAMISELLINLAGEITADSRLSSHIQTAPTRATSSNRRSCKAGIVRRVE